MKTISQFFNKLQANDATIAKSINSVESFDDFDEMSVFSTVTFPDSLFAELLTQFNKSSF